MAIELWLRYISAMFVYSFTDVFILKVYSHWISRVARDERRTGYRFSNFHHDAIASNLREIRSAKNFLSNGKIRGKGWKIEWERNRLNWLNWDFKVKYIILHSPKTKIKSNGNIYAILLLNEKLLMKRSLNHIWEHEECLEIFIFNRIDFVNNSKKSFRISIM